MIIIQDLIKLQVNSTFNIENLKIWSMVICIVYVEARWTMDHGPWCFPYVGTPSLYPPKKKKKNTTNLITSWAEQICMKNADWLKLSLIEVAKNIHILYKVTAVHSINSISEMYHTLVYDTLSI